MARGEGGFRWIYDELTPRLTRLPAELMLAIDEILAEMAEEIETYMVDNAPWEDRSGDARDGLRADLVRKGPVRRSIRLYHTVSYGLWLEVRWSGQYAIIVPTIETMGPRVMTALEGVLSEL